MRRLLPFLVLVLAAAACSSGEPDIAPPVGADAATTAALPASTANDKPTIRASI